MIGFVGCFAHKSGVDAHQAAVALMARTFHCPETAPFALGEEMRLHAENADASFHRGEAGSLHCILVGEIYIGADQSPVQALLTAYRRDGIEGAVSLNGSYAFMLHDSERNRIVVGVDQNAVIPVYYAQTNDRTLVSWDAYALSDELPTKPGIDHDSLFTWLQYGGRGFGDATRFEGIHRLEPGAAVILGERGVSRFTPKPFAFVDSGQNQSELLDDAAACLIEANRRRTAHKDHVFIGLSGGLDSRIVLAAAQQRKKLIAYTYGPENFLERDIAQEVASALGVPHAFAVVGQDDFMNRAPEGVFFSGGASLFKHGVQRGLFQGLQAQFQGQGLMLGSALDLLVGGTFLPEEAFRLQSNAELSAHLQVRLANFDDEVWSALFQDPTEAKRRLESARETLHSAIMAVPGGCAADVNDAFSFETRIKRWYNPNLIYMLMFHRLLMPTYDTDFLDVVSRVSAAGRRGSDFRIRLLKRLSKEAASLPWDATMQPAELAAEEAARHIDRARAQDRELVRRMQAGEAFVPSNRFDANFRDWLRTSPDCIKYFEEVLLGPDALLTREVLSAEGVRNLLRSHARYEGGFHKQLIMLVSAEWLFRTHRRGMPDAPEKPFSWKLSNDQG